MSQIWDRRHLNTFTTNLTETEGRVSTINNVDLGNPLLTKTPNNCQLNGRNH